MIWIAIYATVISGLLLWRSEYKLYKINKEIEHLDIRIDVIGDKFHEHIRKEKFVRLFGENSKNDLFEYFDHIYSYSQLYDLYSRIYGDINPKLVTRIDTSKYTQKGTK